MNERDQLIAYLATLVALIVVVLGAMIIGALSGVVIGKIEAFGIGTVTGGLIGVLKLPARPAGSSSQADLNLATALDKVPPATTGTGPAEPIATPPT